MRAVNKQFLLMLFFVSLVRCAIEYNSDLHNVTSNREARLGGLGLAGAGTHGTIGGVLGGGIGSGIIGGGGGGSGIIGGGSGIIGGGSGSGIIGGGGGSGIIGGGGGSGIIGGGGGSGIIGGGSGIIAGGLGGIGGGGIGSSAWGGYQILPLHSDCWTQASTPGVCLTNADCHRGRGSASGVCWPAGVCCYTTLRCSDNASNAKRIYILGNDVQAGSLGECLYTVTPFSQNVGQLKIEFSTYFQTGSGIVNGSGMPIPDCQDTFLLIGGIKYCGMNVRQHIYLPFGPGNTANGQIIFRHLSNNPALWELVITQIEFPPDLLDYSGMSINVLRNLPKSKMYDYNLIAPSGCDQYFTTTFGIVRSFNYNYGIGPYPPDYSYTICIRRPFNAQLIEYTFTHFHLGSNGVDPCVVTNPISPSQVSGDYMVIPLTQDAAKEGEQCNMSLNGTTVKSTNPGVFAVHFTSGKYLGPNQQVPPNPEARAFEFAYTVMFS